jgi:hypothetical protein
MKFCMKQSVKNGWVILILDFEKTYDNACWGFLMKCIKVGGFNSTWCEWMEIVLYNGTMAIKINGQMCSYFQSYRGVTGDPLSPLLFNIMADCLTHMVLKAQSNSRITGLIPHLIPNGVAIL